MVMGNTTIHEDVFREIVRLVLEEVDGVYCYEPKNPLAPLLGDKSIRPAITIKWPSPDEENQEHISVEIKLAALYGAAIPQMVNTIRKETAERVQKFTGYEVFAVDVLITRLIKFDKEKQAEDEEPAIESQETK
jgi:uncharacterized alkaline shock family protein YloU